jgi:hypothetical protein
MLIDSWVNMVNSTREAVGWTDTELSSGADRQVRIKLLGGWGTLSNQIIYDLIL